MATNTRWSGLDGLRAIAVAAVVGFHFTPNLVPGGFLGVDVFFVLSGYLITRMLVTEFAARGRIDLGRFYARRARRLLPAVGLLLVAGLAASAFWRDQLATIRQATAAAAAYVSNWWLAYDHQSYFVSAGRPSMLQHLWSLGVEEQFYLVWPVLALVVLRRGAGSRRPVAAARRLALAAGALALTSTALLAGLAVLDHVPYGSDGSRLYYGTDTHSMGLLLGAAAGALSAVRLRPRPTPRHLVWATDVMAVAGLVGVLALFALAGQYDTWLYRGGFLLVAAVACAVVWTVPRRGSRVGRALDAAPLRWVGARSYAIYLWHWPVAVFTRPGVDLDWPSPLVQALRVAVTVALADLTYRTVERPVRSLGLRAAVRAGRLRVVRMLSGRAPVGARLAGVGAAAVVTLAVAVLVTAPAPPTSAAQRSMGDATGSRSMRLGAVQPAPTAGDILGAAPSVPPTSTPVPSTVRSPAGSPSPSPASPPRRAGPLPASAFGDSVMLGARAMLGQHFPGGTLDAVEGRQPDPILGDVRSDARHGMLHPLVIIGVGDNGLIDPSVLRTTLSVLRGHRVIVINNRVDRPWESPNNRTIAGAVRGRPNVRLLDWHRRSAGHPAWFYDDGIHLTPDGARAYSAMLAQLAAG